MRAVFISDTWSVGILAAWSALVVLILFGLLACGGSSTGTSGSAQSAESLATTIDDLIIGAALLDPDSGYVMIDGRNFTGGYPPVVTLDGVTLTVTEYTPTEITADYTGPPDPTGILLLTVQTGPALTDYDSYSIIIGDVDFSDPVSFNQLVVRSLRVEMQSGDPWLIIQGNNFDNGSMPIVFLGDLPLPVTSNSAIQIEADLPDIAALAEGAVLTVQTGPDYENYDSYDLNIGDDSGQIPPDGSCYPCWSEGPEDKNPWSGGSVWYEPIYYQLEHDYTVDIPSYFTDYWYMPVGYRWATDDLRDYALNDLPASAVAYTGWDYIVLEPGGMLTIKKGYRWDGPTTSPLKYSSKIIHASMVHDTIYDLMRRGDIPRDYKPYTDEGVWNRLMADCLLYMISKDEGYWRARAFADFVIVRDFGWGKTNASMPGWKEHAVAEAGPDQDSSCGTPGGVEIDLDGTASRHALSWTWEENGTQIATGPDPTVVLPLGIHTVTLTADDPSAKDRGFNHYPDSDDVQIQISIDAIPPEIQVPAQSVIVPNDPGECSAVIQLDVTATDDCGAPQIFCEPPSDEPFPVGTQETVCTAVDGAGNTDTGSFDVTVEDVEPPVIVISPVPLTLWPPNHKYVTLTGADLVESVTDNCEGLSLADLVITGAVSNEPDNEIGVGDGNTIDDIVITPGGSSVLLRSERQGTNSGRIYTVTLELTDEWGNTTEGSAEVLVTHSK